MADWEAAYQLHAPAIRGYLRRRLPRAGEAEDLCQETFARVLERDVLLQDPTRLRSYLMRTAHNLLVNHLRRPPIVALAGDVDPHGDLEDAADPAESSADLELRELEDRLQRGLDALPQRQAEIFRRAALQREPYAVIARDLGLSTSAVKVAVFRVRKHLSSLLDPMEVRDGTL